MGGRPSATPGHPPPGRQLRVKLEGEQATAFCYGTASHYRPTRSGRNTRVFVGSYDLHLRRVEGRWQIDGLRFTLKYLDGNAELEKGE
jgi:SnoaL-like protein